MNKITFHKTIPILIKEKWKKNKILYKIINRYKLSLMTIKINLLVVKENKLIRD
jgi:hypothetical protein